MTTNGKFCALKSQISNVFLKNKKAIIFLTILFVIGLFVGIAGVHALKKNFELEDIKDMLLIKSISGNASFLSYFFKRFLGYVLAMAIVFLLCLNFYLGLLNVFYIFYRAFKIGFNIAIYCTFFGTLGVMNIVFLYLPFQIVGNFVLIVFSSISLNQARFFGKCKTSPNISNYAYVAVFAIIFLALALVEALIVPISLKSTIFCA